MQTDACIYVRMHMYVCKDAYLYIYASAYTSKYIKLQTYTLMAFLCIIKLFIHREEINLAMVSIQGILNFFLKL